MDLFKYIEIRQINVFGGGGGEQKKTDTEKHKPVGVLGWISQQNINGKCERERARVNPVVVVISLN